MPNLAATHCKHGHEMTADNTLHSQGSRRRRCRTCRHTQWQRWRDLHGHELRSLRSVHVPFEPLAPFLQARDFPLDRRAKQRLEKARWVGRLTVEYADELACKRLGVHPYAIWGDDYFVGLPDD